MMKVGRPEHLLDLLLVFVPIAAALELLFHAGPVLVFAASALAIVPLAGVMGRATEDLADRLGEGPGALLNATFGNAAEHSTAVLMARKNRMDISINIAVGSSIQVALFVAPVLVFLSYWIGPSPMDLLFTTLEVMAVVLAAVVMAMITQDGETNWMEGVQLLAVYIIPGIAFFFFK